MGGLSWEKEKKEKHIISTFYDEKVTLT